ncbi:tRNA(Ile)-lysidine synthase [Aneurinibacillus soli]|uniref:tRNA(Ile)-lysidine synthase n=1 Tax=Aneurinibacillus soli TaxID=1500254 RepID=A0A0U4NAT2_9BACL|nr:tRNA lysidine(34) synthetase TilS [Aneurinibacillus soli]PYE58341.1 tRNA(Ile)-lysidine synthase [Aneurinibacillus soli]BAU26180.1 tRNA(Ile)-lysidine synthase [Aneurinibacillus soli]
MRDSLLVHVQRFIKERDLIHAGDAIVIAVSGGPDSVALLHLFAGLQEQHNFHLTAAHLNHCFRGKESEADSRYVQSVCAKLSVPCVAEAIDVPRVMAETGAGTQEAARQVRYHFLHRVAKETGSRIIATAHHADDQMETVLMRLVRGTGIEGLAGIPVQREEEGLSIIRPMLTVTREEIEAYCAAHDLQPRHDQSNDSDKYLRNRIRRHWMPLMKQENPHLADAITQLTALARDENDLMDQITRDTLAEIIHTKNPNTIVIVQNGFVLHHVALQRRMIKLILSYLLKSDIGNIRYFHIENIRQIIADTYPSGRLDLPGGIQVRREYQRVVFSSIYNDVSIPPYIYTLEVPGVVYIPEIDRTFRSRFGKRTDVENAALAGTFAVFDPAKIKGKLYVRQRRAGDRMTVLGMTGTKKVKDIFIDAKIPQPDRESIPLLTDESQILWIPGIRRSAAYIPEESTGDLLYVEFQ